MAQNPTYAAGTVQNTPYGLLHTNPLGSPFVGESIYSPQNQAWLERAVMTNLFNQTPKKYRSPDVDLLMAKYITQSETSPGDEFEYFEQPFMRFPLVIDANAAAVAASVGNTVSATYTVTATSLIYYGAGSVVYFPDGTNGLITAVPTTTTVTIQSLANKGLPAVTAGQTLADGGIQGADGQDRFMFHRRLPVIRRHNYFTKIGPETQKWDRIERAKVQNTQYFNYIEENNNAIRQHLMFSCHNSIWVRQRGEGALNAPNEKYKSFQGLHDAMVTAGAPIVSVSVSALKDTFMFLGQATDFGGFGEMRTLCGSPRILTELGQQLKWEHTRYKNEDMQLKLDVEGISFSGMQFTMQQYPTWNSTGAFPAAYQNRIYCINWNNVSMVSMRGIPMFEYDLRTLSRSNGSPGSEKDYEIAGCQAFFSLKINNPANFFCIEVTGL